MVFVILKPFVPCLSWMTLLEQEDTLSNHTRRQFILISMDVLLFTDSYKQLEQFPPNIVLAGTLSSFKNLLDKYWEQ